MNIYYELKHKINLNTFNQCLKTEKSKQQKLNEMVPLNSLNIIVSRRQRH